MTPTSTHRDRRDERDRTDVVVLAGGRSARFGSDKTRAPLDGTTLLERVLASVTATGELVPLGDVVVVGSWAPDGVRLEIEPERDLGPLAGLAHGLAHVRRDRALVLAGDHPALVPELLALLVERATSSAADVVAPDGPTGPEPLVACYRTTLHAVAARRLDEGRRSLRGLLEESTVEWVRPAQWRAVDPDGISFRDVDTPEDLARFTRDT